MANSAVRPFQIAGKDVEAHMHDNHPCLLVQVEEGECLAFICYDDTLDVIDLMTSYIEVYLTTTLPYGRAVPYHDLWVLRNEIMLYGTYGLAAASSFKGVYANTRWFQVVSACIKKQNPEYNLVKPTYGKTLTETLTQADVHWLVKASQMLEIGGLVTIDIENSIGCLLGKMSLGHAVIHGFEYSIEFANIQDSSSIVLDEVFYRRLSDMTLADLLKLKKLRLGFLNYAVDVEETVIDGASPRVKKQLRGIADPSVPLIRLRLSKYEPIHDTDRTMAES